MACDLGVGPQCENINAKSVVIFDMAFTHLDKVGIDIVILLVIKNHSGRVNCGIGEGGGGGEEEKGSGRRRREKGRGR